MGFRVLGSYGKGFQVGVQLRFGLRALGLRVWVAGSGSVWVRWKESCASCVAVWSSAGTCAGTSAGTCAGMCAGTSAGTRVGTCADSAVQEMFSVVLSTVQIYATRQ